MSTDSLMRLLELLSDGQVRSGDALGEALGISRAAVWKQVRAAQARGIPFSVHRGKGYRLPAGFEMLDARLIRQQCSQETRHALATIEVLGSIDSTNSHVLRCYQQGEEALPLAILAEEQTAGRGRRGRVWHSPMASNIYLTLGWVFSGGVAALEGLSLIVGLKVLEVLEQCGARDLQLKWPNDVCRQQRKLAGILIDVQGDPAGLCFVATGIGINVQMPQSMISRIDQPWVDLATVLNEEKFANKAVISRNTLAAALLDHLVPVFNSLPDKGFAAYQSAWQGHDVCYGKAVQLQSGRMFLEGVGRGVNSQGAYGIAVQGQAGVHYVSGGEISLRLSGKSIGEA